MSIDPTPTYRTELPLAQRINVAYFKLAYECMLPAVEALAAGKPDIEALLAVAFSPVMHSLLACIAPTNAWCVLPLLQRLIRPAHPVAITRFENPRSTALFLETHRNRKQLVKNALGQHLVSVWAMRQFSRKHFLFADFILLTCEKITPVH